MTLRCSLLFRVFAVVLLTSGITEGQSRQTLFRDDFNRPSSSALGSPWTESAELTSDIYTAGRYVGPGYIEVESNTMAFHFTTHSLRPFHFFESTNANPYAQAPLAHTVNALPAGFSLTFTPHEDE